ncbi:Hypothetical protein CAP_3805 [Chondromyces apiculatus DSM 436]|uniref:Uncharacterized protein n=1 Tax=Chondromyces apiculatus DSM 436 TaxID=1192034 RepID=A0A017T6Z3_9BACT|nr:Hypothetical protein CAP_3805 [Chondromyces apiculatus DSM 436]
MRSPPLSLPLTTGGDVSLHESPSLTKHTSLQRACVHLGPGFDPDACGEVARLTAGV